VTGEYVRGIFTRQDKFETRCKFTQIAFYSDISEKLQYIRPQQFGDRGQLMEKTSTGAPTRTGAFHVLLAVMVFCTGCSPDKSADEHQPDAAGTADIVYRDGKI